MRITLAALLAAAAVMGWTATATAQRLGPPGGTIYAFDQGFRTIGTPTELPDRGAFDTLYQFPDCPSCAAVSDAAPGSGDYRRFEGLSGCYRSGRSMTMPPQQR